MLPLNSKRHSAASLRRNLSEYVRRLFRVRQMDLEYTLWQMGNLCFRPKKVYRTTAYHRQTKLQWARDDPAFVAILSGLVAVASLAYCIAFGKTVTRRFMCFSCSWTQLSLGYWKLASYGCQRGIDRFPCCWRCIMFCLLAYCKHLFERERRESYARCVWTYRRWRRMAVRFRCSLQFICPRLSASVLLTIPSPSSPQYHKYFLCDTLQFTILGCFHILQLHYFSRIQQWVSESHHRTQLTLCQPSLNCNAVHYFSYTLHLRR